MGGGGVVFRCNTITVVCGFLYSGGRLKLRILRGEGGVGECVCYYSCTLRINSDIRSRG